MGLINLTLPSDGETIDAADVNTPFGTIATAINGNLDNANIKSGAAIDGTKIASATLTATQMADSVSPVKRWDEGLADFVASGCVWSGDAYGSTRVASMTSGVVYINGKRISVSAVTSRTFTASKDTYVDIDENGTISYSEITNNAASPSLAANSIRIAIIVTGASNIANQYSINQGQIAKTTTDIRLPRSTSHSGTDGSVITDTDGNRICNRDPQGKLVAHVTRNGSSTSGASATNVAWNGMSWILFNAVANTNYIFTFHEPVFSGYGGGGQAAFGAFLATSANTETTPIGEFTQLMPTSSQTGATFTLCFNSGTYSGKTYLNIRFRSGGISGTITINGDSTREGQFWIEKV